MKPKQGYALHKVGLAIVIALCAAFVAYETQPRTISAAQSFAGAEGRTHKHPKLSTQVAHLKRAVPQNTQPPAPGERIASPPGFAVEKLPKSIRDAVHAGQMHITNDAEVQVYISVSEISERNL